MLNNSTKKVNKFTICIFLLLATIISCGCSLNIIPNITGAENINMTPRLITLSEGLKTSEVVSSVKSAIVGIKSTTLNGYSVGSGVAIKDGGYILTNHHVIANSKAITIYFADKSTAGATLVWQDSSVDLAVIKSKVNLPYLECETQDVQVGNDVLAIGTPLSLAFQHTVTKGIVSALDRTLEVQNSDGSISYMQNLIQHDASINPGNSGGPLINSSGKVIGINTLKATDAEGIGFAIPIVAGVSIVERLSENNGYTAPYMGIMGISTDFARSKNLVVDTNGLYVLDVDKNSEAGRIGLKSGDVIYKVNDTIINSYIDLRNIIYNHKTGDKLQIYVDRSGEKLQFSMTLIER